MATLQGKKLKLKTNSLIKADHFQTAITVLIPIKKQYQANNSIYFLYEDL
ncbi:hypothetical protein SR1949_14890 [Sphaerospermopsis reniformis]|uniref:Uncharacterized protein n=1 Tax=Sphaerospermopsis reniformis TaxID=531300 RepID=A0A479ZXR8_9CYAN|nr:hypothetical protein SR1949_14890 [Sphaerospermopsis reniformis]